VRRIKVKYQKEEIEKMKQLRTCILDNHTYYVGQRIKKQFPISFRTRYPLTEVISGTIEKIVETKNAIFATIIQDNERLRFVVLGPKKEQLGPRKVQ
jgi:hypothetical protein